MENISTSAADGYTRYVQAFNGTIPGPAIIADWGDDVIVHVTNNMEYNGTTVHWHGIRQLNNSQYDGVPGVTQCPIAPGDTLTYKFHAERKYPLLGPTIRLCGANPLCRIRILMVSLPLGSPVWKWSFRTFANQRTSYCRLR